MILSSSGKHAASAGNTEAAARLSTALKAAVGERLPAYMVPTYLCFLEAFPMTPNGKIDRRGVAEIPGWEKDPATLAAVAPSEEPREVPWGSD